MKTNAYFLIFHSANASVFQKNLEEKCLISFSLFILK